MKIVKLVRGFIRRFGKEYREGQQTEEKLDFASTMLRPRQPICAVCLKEYVQQVRKLETAVVDPFVMHEMSETISPGPYWIARLEKCSRCQRQVGAFGYPIRDSASSSK